MALPCWLSCQGGTSGVVLVAVILASPVSSPSQRLQSAESRPRRRQSSRPPAQRRVRGSAPARRGVTRHRPESGPQCLADSAPLTEPYGGGRAEAPGSGECASPGPSPPSPHPNPKAPGVGRLLTSCNPDPGFQNREVLVGNIQCDTECGRWL